MPLVNLILRRMWTGSFRNKECTHLDLVQDVTPQADVCEECVALEDTWPELRMCTICGHVGCCDGSKNQHMLKHFETTTHPIARPVDRGLFFKWMWCYVDQALLDAPS